MKIFICASKHNYRHIPDLKAALERLGHDVILPNSFDDPFLELRTKAQSPAAHVALKRQFLRKQADKVRASDAVLVVNCDKGDAPNYIGGATFLELYKGFELGKKLFLYNPIPTGPLEDEIVGMDPTVINGDLALLQ